MIDPAQVAREVRSRALAGRLVATLDDRPFVPTAVQLAWIEGGELIPGQEDGALARIVAGRFAIVFANHVIGDVAAKDAPGAYIRIVECARQAFLQSLPRPALRADVPEPDPGTVPRVAARRRPAPSRRPRADHSGSGRIVVDSA